MRLIPIGARSSSADIAVLTAAIATLNSDVDDIDTAITTLNTEVDYATVFINVKSYGALGDGTTDDSTAINAAITAANAAGGGVVWFPVGTYICQNITLKSYVILRGTGFGSVLKLKNSTTADVIKSAATNAATAIQYAGIEYLCIDGNKANQSNGVDLQQYGISLNGASNCWAVNVYVKDTQRGGIYMAGARNLVTKCLFSGIGKVGAASSIIGRSAISMDNYNTTDIIANYSRVTYNVVLDCLEHGIKIYDTTKGGEVVGNLVTNAGDKGIEVMGTTRTRVDFNEVDACYSVGIHVGDGTHAGVRNSCVGNTVNGTLTVDFTGHGILWRNQTGGVIADNEVTGNRTHGIFIYQSSGVGIDNNDTHGNGLDGGYSGILLYESPNCTVSNNRSSDNGSVGSNGNGIMGWDGGGTACTNIVVTGNRCWDTGAGVQAYGVLSGDASNYWTVASNGLSGNVTGTHSLAGANNVYTAGAV